MAQRLELTDMNFKTAIIKMLKNRMEKMDNVCKQM